MTLEEFVKNILGNDVSEYSQSEIEGLYAIVFPFANFAMKKWNDKKVETVI
jgi:hypothetical protein